MALAQPSSTLSTLNIIRSVPVAGAHEMATIYKLAGYMSRDPHRCSLENVGQKTEPGSQPAQSMLSNSHMLGNAASPSCGCSVQHEAYLEQIPKQGVSMLGLFCFWQQPAQHLEGAMSSCRNVSAACTYVPHAVSCMLLVSSACKDPQDSPTSAKT